MAIDYTDPNIMYFVGKGYPPDSTSVTRIYGNVAIGLIIDIRTSEVLDVNLTLTSPLSIDFIKAQIVGKNLVQDFEAILKNVERYQGPALKSIIVALKSAHNRYLNYIESYESV